MVFAAGHGTRMRPLTDDRPKALVQVAGRALLDHALEQVAGPGPLAVNAHHHARQIEAHLAGGPAQVLVEENALLDTGGGLKNALPVLGAGPVVTMNGDAVWHGPAARATLTEAWDPERMDGLLLIVPADRAINAEALSFGLEQDGRLTRETRDHAFTGAGIVKIDGLAAFEGVFSLRDLWWKMLAAGRLFGVVHPGHWAEVGRPEHIAPAEAMLARLR
ncbi:Bifunctional protein GlmU [Jannaschia aquimarina]|uniref:GlmU_2 protein n=2 Tax=Jannaschia aquimarina TaxID=935700 RepID=A0A0D1D625_9RHOB|nr:nucleotidyltransferase family protein [Jannaschia aquimarina]KIT15443.1 Bifunctional protein GlmU [Jannaschia aquimarina]SNT22293.1 MurNAc alpha-1-phosphate uridylyltransferase [Jannaschia aquimarina]